MSEEITELSLSALQSRLGGSERLNGRLMEFAAEGNLSGVRLAIIAGADHRTARDLLGRTPVHEAVIHGRIEVLALLRDIGADLNAEDISSGSTPAHMAAYRGCIKALALLRDARANLSAKDDHFGRTPAYILAANGYTEGLALLYDAGADLHTRANDGRTPADIAAAYGHAEAATFLESLAGIRTEPKVTVSISDLTAVFGEAVGCSGGGVITGKVKQGPVHKFA